MKKERRNPRGETRDRLAREDARRRDGHHCPVCLSVLPRIAGAARPGSVCSRCAAQAAPDKRCSKCHQAGVWEGPKGAACPACGHHGSRVRVIAGREWLDEPET
jgi:hypothetical protein